MSVVYDKVNEAFKKTSKILFKQEIGELEEFEPYFKEIMLPGTLRNSFISGKEVFTSHYYPKNARIVSQDELGQLKFKPLDISQVKDIDSLIEAVGENVVYCGNRLFGKTENVEYADIAGDCLNVKYVHDVFESKYSAYMSPNRQTEYCFGVSACPSTKFSMRCIWGLDVTRCFEAHYCNESNDCMFGYNISGCSENLFSFNLKSKRHVIGNLELPKERYFELKEKLVGEIAEKLKKNKRIISVMDIPKAYGELKTEIPKYHEGAEERAQKSKKINEAFAATSRIVLGKELGPISEYEKWLVRNNLPVKVVMGALGTVTTRVTTVPVLKDAPAERFVTQEEALRLGKEKKISVDEGEAPGLEEMLKRVAEIAYYTHEMKMGKNEDVVDVSVAYSSKNLYRLFDSTYSKHSGCAFMAVKSEHIFGGKHRMLQSKFCINCYDSVNLNNCFEVDGSYDSSDCYFCHNVENVDNGIFCFNVKSKRYCVGNTEVGKEEFLRVKKILLDYVLEELEKDKDLELSIFNIKVPG